MGVFKTPIDKGVDGSPCLFKRAYLKKLSAPLEILALGDFNKLNFIFGSVFALFFYAVRRFSCAYLVKFSASFSFYYADLGTKMRTSPERII